MLQVLLGSMRKLLASALAILFLVAVFVAVGRVRERERRLRNALTAMLADKPQKTDTTPAHVCAPTPLSDTVPTGLVEEPEEFDTVSNSLTEGTVWIITARLTTHEIQDREYIEHKMKMLREPVISVDSIKDFELLDAIPKE